MKSHTIHFREQDKNNFDALQSGEKIIESRAATGKFVSIEVGDELVFECAGETFSKTVKKRYHWGTVEQMVADVPLKRVIPWVDTLQEAKAVYASFPGYEEKIKEFGILGFEV